MTDLATWLGGFSFTASLETAMVDLKAWFEGLSLYDSGVALINTLTDGILAVKDQIYAKIKEVLGPVGALLPSSDAQEGPLSRLTEAGRAIIDTMVQGIQQANPLQQALLANGAFALPGLTLPLAPGAVGLCRSRGRMAGKRTDITVTFGQGAITVNAEGGDAREIGGQISQVLREEIRATVEQADSQVRA